MMRSLTLIAVLICFAVPAFADGMTASQVYKASEPSIMVLTVKSKDGNTYTGTGFVAIKDGLAVTAWHVVHDAVSVTAKFSDGQEFEVPGLVDNDPKRDIALIKVKEFGRTPLVLSQTTPDVGDKAFVIGAPEGLDFTVSDGLVSQIRQQNGVNYYQFSSPASHGNSGGPVLNDIGEVIGVVSFQYTEGQNLNFAVPSTYVLGLDGTLPTQPWSGVKDNGVPGQSGGGAAQTLSNDELDPKLAKDIALSLDTSNLMYFYFDQVVGTRFGFLEGPGADSYKLRQELGAARTDLQSVTSTDPLRSSVLASLRTAMDHLYNQVDNYILAVEYKGKHDVWDPDYETNYKREAALVEMPEDQQIQTLLQSQRFRDAAPALSSFYGPRSYNSGLRCPFRYPTFVTVVVPGFPADEMALRMGDTLRSVDDEVVTSVYDFNDKLNSHRGKKVKITVSRDGKDKSWNTKVPQE